MYFLNIFTTYLFPTKRDYLSNLISTFSVGKNVQATYYENCKYDVTMTEDKKAAACAMLEALAKECGCDVGDWRPLAKCRKFIISVIDVLVLIIVQAI